MLAYAVLRYAMLHCDVTLLRYIVASCYYITLCCFVTLSHYVVTSCHVVVALLGLVNECNNVA